jgi:hypothetical protein
MFFNALIGVSALGAAAPLVEITALVNDATLALLMFISHF